MPTSTTKTSGPSGAQSVSVGSLASDLRARLEASQSTTIYMPLDEGAEPPSDAELQALLTGGLHVEHDQVRNALAVRNATDDEIAAAVAPHAPAPEPAPASTSSTTP